MDIKNMVNDLILAGLTQVEIAAQIGREQPTVSRYATGDITSTDYSSGVKLECLHRKHRKRITAMKNKAHPAP